MPTDWYPDALAARVPWHANLAAQAASSGVARGLTATQAARAALDSAPLALAVGTLPGIEARTRQHAGVPEAYPARAATAGEACGVAPAGPKGPTVPDLKAAALTQSRVSLGWGRADGGGSAWRRPPPASTPARPSPRAAGGQTRQRDACSPRASSIPAPRRGLAWGEDSVLTTVALVLLALGPGPTRVGVEKTLAKAGVKAPQSRRLIAAMLQDLVDRGGKQLKPKSVRLQVEGSPSVSPYLPLLNLRGLNLGGSDPMFCYLHSAHRSGTGQVVVRGHFVRHQQAGIILQYGLVRSKGEWDVRSRKVVGEI